VQEGVKSAMNARAVDANAIGEDRNNGSRRPVTLFMDIKTAFEPAEFLYAIPKAGFIYRDY